MIFIFAASGLIENLTSKKWLDDALFKLNMNMSVAIINFSN